MGPVTQFKDETRLTKGDLMYAPKEVPLLEIQFGLELPQFAFIDRQLMHRNGGGSSFGFHARRQLARPNDRTQKEIQ
jgi:hypothetical protein